MESAAQVGHNPGMNHEALFDQAVQMAYASFEDPTDAHITGVYAVLIWHAQRGLDVHGVTVH
jgi:hypothetical protein